MNEHDGEMIVIHRCYLRFQGGHVFPLLRRQQYKYTQTMNMYVYIHISRQVSQHLWKYEAHEYLSVRSTQ